MPSSNWTEGDEDCEAGTAGPRRIHGPICCPLLFPVPPLVVSRGWGWGGGGSWSTQTNLVVGHWGRTVYFAKSQLLLDAFSPLGKVATGIIVVPDTGLPQIPTQSRHSDNESKQTIFRIEKCQNTVSIPCLYFGLAIVMHHQLPFILHCPCNGVHHATRARTSPDSHVPELHKQRVQTTVAVGSATLGVVYFVSLPCLPIASIGVGWPCFAVASDGSCVLCCAFRSQVGVIQVQCPEHEYVCHEVVC